MSTHDQTPSEAGDDLAHDSSQLDGVGSALPYVRLQEYVERILQNQRPSTAEPFPAEDADAYHMAAFLRGASPDAGEPDPDFVMRLQARLLADPEPVHDAPPPPPAAVTKSLSEPASPTNGRERQRRVSRVSRRALLGTGLGAAAAAAGVAAGMQIERAASSNSSSHSVELIPNGLGTWTAIATVESIPLGAVKRFETDFVVGFVMHTPAGFSALSGTCTHMGCLLLWNAADHTFDCPCHGGRFTEQGKSAANSPYTYSPLPPIETKVENGQVWVYVIPPQPGSSGSGGGGRGAGTETPTKSYSSEVR